jgi:DNA-3-methyladenine glycosylase
MPIAAPPAALDDPAPAIAALVAGRLPRSFYERPVLEVARACVGAVVVHRTPEGAVAARIVETEAYRGPQDLAAHSAGGRRTRRTEVMFGPPGHAYMFLLYGMHWALNVVAGAAGEPHAILVRAVEPVLGVELMRARRGGRVADRDLTSGPGKLCQALALDGLAYGLDLCGDRLWLAQGTAGRIGRSARINVDYAGAWARKPWRFYERSNRFVSVPPRS